MELKVVVADPFVLEELKPWTDEIALLSNDVVGQTQVLLYNSREKETNFGNFLTDAMVDWVRNDMGQSFAIFITSYMCVNA